MILPHTFLRWTAKLTALPQHKADYLGSLCYLWMQSLAQGENVAEMFPEMKLNCPVKARKSTQAANSRLCPVTALIHLRIKKLPPLVNVVNVAIYKFSTISASYSSLCLIDRQTVCVCRLVWKTMNLDLSRSGTIFSPPPT